MPDGTCHRGAGTQIRDLSAARRDAQARRLSLNKVYMLGLPFYVDERVIVPRSFIGEILDSHFGGEAAEALP